MTAITSAHGLAAGGSQLYRHFRDRHALMRDVIETRVQGARNSSRSDLTPFVDSNADGTRWSRTRLATDPTDVPWARWLANRPTKTGMPDSVGTCQGVAARVARRVLTLAAAIWHNFHTGRPVSRSLTAYDH
ncbi:MAG: hypothetical protein ACJ72W_30125 [Actinoallomurus sp.]